MLRNFFFEMFVCNGELFETKQIFFRNQFMQTFEMLQYLVFLSK